ncbi:glycosyltransferase family 2 protein [Salaquimonas pukyongi]|uniref:glycosyltransferase family 2 protein n=1 Tax=Salaquimonas pukyongi TaxID=2712698 RepID=UPI00096B7A9C|nr:glycosyltransferase family 2 protein [Salaquimonas pukyongi]
MASARKTVSVVIPVYNEEGNIGRLVEETHGAVAPASLGEIIVVDDCSSDKGPQEVLAIARKRKKVRLIRHLENAGQSAALRTGILAANHALIATLDGDGQNDPADLPAMISAIAPAGKEDGPALIGGIRVNRKDTGSKRWASRAANKIRDWVLRDDCPDTGCGIKVFWREAFLKLPFFTSVHRYLPALFQTYGYKTDYVPVNSRERLAGISKYNNFNRALIGFYDLFGVSWLRRRTKHPPVREEKVGEEK